MFNANNREQDRGGTKEYYNSLAMKQWAVEE